MSTRVFLFICCFGYPLCAAPLYGQAITVPTKIQFADLVLSIQADAREEIQKKVTSLTISPKHYQEILERVSLYMPMIERVLKEEGVPEDFKYLVIQESRLTADLISVSHAVGFWQFKQEAGVEVGIRMDQDIDERMHIIASTRGFAKFIKSHYAYFHSWLYALLAHHCGRTGAKDFIKETSWHITGKKAIVDDRVHWYIYHFIAHKIVFQHVVGRATHPELYLYAYHDCQGKTLEELSHQFHVPLDRIQSYNRWLRPTRVPLDAACPMIIPMQHRQSVQPDHLQVENPINAYAIDYNKYWNTGSKFPVIRLYKATRVIHTVAKDIVEINGLKGVIAKLEDTLQSLADRGKVALKKFLIYNEIDLTHLVQAGGVYYLETKQRKAAIHYHVVQPQETWWQISQKYGIKQGSLLTKNRLQEPQKLETGQVVWLRFIRPASIPIAYVKQKALDYQVPQVAADAAGSTLPVSTPSDSF